MEERQRERDILTVHLKIWQQANYRAAGRQIKWGPSQRVVLGQIGYDSVKPLNILPTRGGQERTHKLSQSSSQYICLQPVFLNYIASAHSELDPNTLYSVWLEAKLL